MPADRAEAATGTEPDVAALLAGMSLEDKVGQLFVLAVSGRTADTTDATAVAANRAAYGVDTPAQVIAAHRPGGIIYFPGDQDNLADPQQIAALSNGLQRAAVAQPSRIPLLLSTDQENGGYVVRAPITLLPGEMALAASPRAQDDVRDVATITRDELRAMGLNQDFAPVVDVASNPANPIIHVRSFGDDPGTVSALATTMIRTFQQPGGLVAAAKHFPGHGDTDTDSHTGIPIITRSREELERVDLPPFAAAVDAGIGMIMTAHIVVPALDPSGDPATLSRPILTGVLRDQLGYDGVVITDALNMAGVRQKYTDARVPVLALKAGVDQLLMPPDFPTARDAVLAAVRSGEIPGSRIDEAVTRILRLKRDAGIFCAAPVDEQAATLVVGSAAHLATARAATERGITLLRNDADLLPLSTGPRSVLVTGWGVTTTKNLAKVLTAHGSTTTLATTGISPDAATIGSTVALAKQADLVVVCTRDLGADTSSGQRDLVAELVKAGTPVVSVAVLEPYDIAYTTEVATHLLTYSYAENALEALGRVLYGQVAPTGRLAVDIPRSDATGVLYRRGHHVAFTR
ncbi:glycoside hydrolase family 3 C-terminal domain-containing protein [Clavibacter sp. VKM Ac-2872]|nr:glycoside hydrolase family 3 C-terminal domain-containing protein [Clavibacter sp. VKM Ac-2872]